MQRRAFVKSMAAAGAGTILSSTLPNWVIGKQPSPTQRALIMDAMGEIRLTHTRELIKEVIESGTNAVTVTLCDPKLQEQEAHKIALEGLLAYDRHIQKNSDLFIKAIKAVDVDEAKKNRKISPVLLLSEHDSIWTRFGYCGYFLQSRYAKLPANL